MTCCPLYRPTVCGREEPGEGSIICFPPSSSRRAQLAYEDVKFARLATTRKGSSSFQLPAFHKPSSASVAAIVTTVPIQPLAIISSLQGSPLAIKRLVSMVNFRLAAMAPAAASTASAANIASNNVSLPAFISDNQEGLGARAWVAQHCPNVDDAVMIRTVEA